MTWDCARARPTCQETAGVEGATEGRASAQYNGDRDTMEEREIGEQRDQVHEHVGGTPAGRADNRSQAAQQQQATGRSGGHDEVS